MNGSYSSLLATIRGQFPSQPPKRLGVAVSGGGDSVALLHLLSRCFADEPVTLHAATVDHGLRPEAAREAQMVATLSGTLGIAHETLQWRGWDGAGNLQDAARQARYSLLIGWARGHGIGTLVLGHTADDQAETVLMRLARASGVAGLAGIPPRRMQDGIVLLRPMLGITRAELRDYLTARGMSWVEDPSNRDLRFDRIKARAALEQLAPLGITERVLADVAANMARSHVALNYSVQQAAQDLVELDRGDALLNVGAFNALPEEIARRLLLGLVNWVARAAVYPPRRRTVEQALAALRQGKTGQLGGCLFVIRHGRMRLFREYQALRDLRTPVDQLWDHRWRLHGPTEPDAEIRPLGPVGVQQCAARHETGLPHGALLASPAVWSGERLIAAPLAGFAQGWRAEPVGGAEEFLASLLSH